MAWGLIMAAALASSSPDFDALWNYDDPAGTEAKFQAVRAQVEAAGDHGRLMELDTQIARTQGLQRQFDRAFATLATVHAALKPGEARATARYEMELGRALRSSGKGAEARPHFERARALAAQAHEDALAIDAIHMVALVEPDPNRQIALNREAIGFAQNSTDPKAQRWQASLWNNIGMTEHDQGRLGAALEAFRTALALREQQGDAHLVRVARWMVGWTLRLQGDLTGALAIQSDLAATETDSGDGYVHEELGEIHRALGEPEPARTQFAKAYAMLKDNPDLADDPGRLARMKRLGEGASD